MREYLLSRRDKILDILLERILDKNQYKDLYTVFLIEMQGNDKFKMLFEKIYDESHDNFVEFIKKEGLEEYNAISNREFTFLMNCLYMGIYLFDNVDRAKLKEMLKLMFEAYLT